MSIIPCSQMFQDSCPQSSSIHNGKCGKILYMLNGVQANVKKPQNGTGRTKPWTYQPMPRGPSGCPLPHLVERRRRRILNCCFSLVPSPGTESLRRSVQVPPASRTWKLFLGVISCHVAHFVYVLGIIIGYHPVPIVPHLHKQSPNKCV